MRLGASWLQLALARIHLDLAKTVAANLTLSMLMAFRACGAEKSSSTTRQEVAEPQAMPDETDTPSIPNTDDTTPENAPTAVTVDAESV
jgi:hypothetical protein